MVTGTMCKGQDNREEVGSFFPHKRSKERDGKERGGTWLQASYTQLDNLTDDAIA